jgi:hypothetical protein
MARQHPEGERVLSSARLISPLPTTGTSVRKTGLLLSSPCARVEAGVQDRVDMMHGSPVQLLVELQIEVVDFTRGDLLERPTAKGRNDMRSEELGIPLVRPGVDGALFQRKPTFDPSGGCDPARSYVPAVIGTF